MLDVVLSNQFRRDLPQAKRRGYDLTLLSHVVDTLAKQEPLVKSYRDHHLTGNYVNFRECHIRPDWLLIYRVDEEQISLILFRTGTHADLF